MKQPKNTLKTRTVFTFKSVKTKQEKFETNPTDTSMITYTTTTTGTGIVY